MDRGELMIMIPKDDLLRMEVYAGDSKEACALCPKKESGQCNQDKLDCLLPCG